MFEEGGGHTFDNYLLDVKTNNIMISCTINDGATLEGVHILFSTRSFTIYI